MIVFDYNSEQESGTNWGNFYHVQLTKKERNFKSLLALKIIGKFDKKCFHDVLQKLSW